MSGAFYSKQRPSTRYPLTRYLTLHWSLQDSLISVQECSNIQLLPLTLGRTDVCSTNGERPTQPYAGLDRTDLRSVDRVFLRSGTRPKDALVKSLSDSPVTLPEMIMKVE